MSGSNENKLGSIASAVCVAIGGRGRHGLRSNNRNPHSSLANIRRWSS